MSRAHIALSITLCLFASACGTDSPLQGSICDPGATQWCACPGGVTGVQVCNLEGSAWGSCNQCGVVQPDGAAPPPPAPPLDGGVIPAEEVGPPPSPDGAPPNPPAAMPVMFAAGHYLTYQSQLAALGPYIVYGWAADPALQMYSKELQTLAQIQDPGVEKWLMFSSVKTLQSKLSDPGHAAYLKSVGVTGLGYNSEGDKTPSSEMQNLPSAVSQFAGLAQSHGFKSVWGPIRVTADKTSDAAYTQMINAGLDGIGLQEQKWIESSCADQRSAAVKSLSARLKQLAGSTPFQIQVQIMPSRCLNGDAYAQKSCNSSGPKFHHCQTFFDQIAGVVGSMAIWASSPADNANLVPLIKALRHK